MDNNTKLQGSHYKGLVIEPIAYIHANVLGFDEGNIVKYISRHQFKNGADDVLKAMDYCFYILESQYGMIPDEAMVQLKKMLAFHK